MHRSTFEPQRCLLPEILTSRQLAPNGTAWSSKAWRCILETLLTKQASLSQVQE